MQGFSEMLRRWQSFSCSKKNSLLASENFETGESLDVLPLAQELLELGF
jgi:hypothetical protein